MNIKYIVTHHKVEDADLDPVACEGGETIPQVKIRAVIPCATVFGVQESLFEARLNDLDWSVWEVHQQAPQKTLRRSVTFQSDGHTIEKIE